MLKLDVRMTVNTMDNIISSKENVYLLNVWISGKLLEIMRNYRLSKAELTANNAFNHFTYETKSLA
jgi:hypothetical protein